MTTIKKVKNVMKMRDESMDNLAIVPSANLVNEKIIVALMVEIKSDKQALTFCDLMKILVTNKSSITDIRNGMKLINILVTLSAHAILQ